MYNLGTVMRFEIVRTLKKKSFWIMAVGFPIMFAAIFGIIFKIMIAETVTLSTPH